MIRNAALAATLALLGAAGAYTVKKGDTLFSIARANGTTVAEVQRLNGLGPSTALEVGQVLKVPGEAGSTGAPASAPRRAPTLPPPLPAEQLAPTSTSKIAGVTINVPTTLRMGEAFTLRLSGERASQATVRFPSEVGEDVRQPGEVLRPTGAAGEYSVLGRVVLGKTTPLVYEVAVGGDLVRARISVAGLDQPIQHLNLPQRISRVLQDPGRAAEEKAVEAAYARRTPRVWSKPFAAPLKVNAVSSSFGQPRTYTAGGEVAYHFGTDFPAPVGTPISAVNDGTVVVAGTYPVRGGLVAIDHGDGLTSLYFHQSKVLVKVGQKVRRGDVIGRVGSAGLSAGPHLHLEMRVRGEGTNPADWLGRVLPR